MKNIKNWVLSPTPPTSTDVGWIKPVDGEYRLYVKSGGKFIPCTSSIDSNKEAIQQLVLDTLSYGVSWKPGVADTALTRVGNMQYHKTLPIQNGMKGCVVQCKDSVSIQYYLDPNDWRFKKDGVINFFTIGLQYEATADASMQITSYKLYNDAFSTLQYESQYVKLIPINDSSKVYICKVKSLDTSSKNATLEVPDDMPKTVPELMTLGNVFNVELGSVLNGYDGEVMVEVPEFWIRSWDTDTQREVRVSPMKIDDSWEHQPRVLIAAYKDALLKTVPENMGYLSTLEQNTLVSICNTNTYCRGGIPSSSSSTSAYDSYLETDPFFTELGKPVGGSYGQLVMDGDDSFKKGGKNVLTYAEYKNILYWLYVIEYANFDCMLPFTTELTSEGYRQGGLGEGVTTLKKYLSLAFTPNGYTNELGNNTAIKEGYSPTYGQSQYIPRWHGIENPFGDGGIVVGGLEGTDINIDSKAAQLCYRTDTVTPKYIGTNYHKDGYIKELNLLDSAEILPREIVSGNDNKGKFKCTYAGVSMFDWYAYIAFGNPTSNSVTTSWNYDLHRLGSIYSINKSFPSYDLMGVRTSVVVSK